MSVEEIYNYRRVSEGLVTGGMPTEAQIRAAAEEGFGVVINLATFSPGHSLVDEGELVRSLGMEYYAIPVEWEAPAREDFMALEKLLLELGPARILLHCAANYRASAFYALFAQKHLGWSEAQAEAFRMSIWAGSDYPTWEKLIAELRAEMSG
jgi:protein tyrosine phosphatase (PTP) superfamily phosphohydrolase (DUF442 family)